MSFYVILVTINFLLRVVMFGLRFGYYIYIYISWRAEAEAVDVRDNVVYLYT